MLVPRYQTDFICLLMAVLIDQKQWCGSLLTHTHIHARTYCASKYKTANMEKYICFPFISNICYFVAYLLACSFLHRLEKQI